ncbi:MAG: hypothetical protein QXI91_06310 [Candidatus Bathyarchaeia archaeon]
MPSNKPEITSAEFVSFNQSIILSEHYLVLSRVAREIGSLYGNSQNTTIQQLANVYYTMEKEITHLSEIVKMKLQNYDNEIRKAEAILTDVDCGLLCDMVIGGVCSLICAAVCGCPANLACCVFCAATCPVITAIICGYICGDVPTLCALGCAATCGAASSLCGSLSGLCDAVCNAGCLQLIGPLCEGKVTEVRYMRGDQHTVNGLTAYKLETSQSDIAKSISQGYTGLCTFTCSINVAVRHADGSETSIANGVAAVGRGSSGPGTWEGIQSATWDCPSVPLEPTDAIKITVNVICGPSWHVSTATFITEPLGATGLVPSTWTVYYYTKLVASTYPYYPYASTSGFFLWGTAAYNSRIEGFTYIK